MGRPAPTGPRSQAQNRQIWATLAQLGRASGLGKDDLDGVLRGIVREISGQESTTQLTIGQAAAVARQLDERLARHAKPAAPAAAQAPKAAEHEPWGRRGPGKREDRTITPRQQAVIGALFRQIGWSDRPRQTSFCMRQVKRPWPQTIAEGDALIEPLQAMALRKVAPIDAWTRAKNLQGRPELDTWQRGFVADLCEQFERADAVQNLGSALSSHKLLKLIEAELRCGVSP